MAEPKHSIETLMQRYYNDMVRLACSILRDPAEADDAAQAAFIDAARNLESFEGRAEIRTWLYRITANTCLSLLRKRRARQALQNTLAGVQALFGGGKSLEEQVAAREERERRAQIARRSEWGGGDDIGARRGAHTVVDRRDHELGGLVSLAPGSGERPAERENRPERRERFERNDRSAPETRERRDYRRPDR